MANTTNLRLKQNKQKLLAARYKQYEAAMADLVKARSGAEKVTIEEDVKQLESEILGLEQEIQEMTSASVLQSAATLQTEPDSPQVRQVIREYEYAWQGKIHRIDFTQSRKIFEPILGRFENTGGSVLFFFQRSASRGGKWCTQAIKDYLDRFKLEPVPPREFTFESHDIAEPEPFLNFLASKYDLAPRDQPAEDIKTYAGRINQAVRQSLYPGSVFLLQVQIKCELADDDRFIRWFVNEFWRDLCGPLSPAQRIRLVGILSIDIEVPKVLIETLRCTKRTFNPQKLLALPLHKWKKDEICGWLIDHSGLSKPPISMSQTQLERMAASIYAKSTSGEPVTVYSELLSEMSRRVG